jgi:hypothetical protein
MHRLCLIFLMLLLLPFIAAAQGPQVVVDHGKVSINVEDMRLGELLRLWDQATGMRSSFPPALANRAVSVQLSGLTENEAIRALFRKLDVDYVFIEGQGIVVTGPSLTAVAPSERAPAVAAAAPEPGDEVRGEETVEPLQVESPRQPKLIPTPFGPIPDSSRNQMVHLPPVPGETPPPPFFALTPRLTPPAGAANGPIQNNLFAPISIYQNPILPPLNSRP